MYAVNELGQVKALERYVKHEAKITGLVTRALKRERILTGCKDACGYLHYRLCKQGKYKLFKGHVLVAQAFLGYDVRQYSRKNLESLVIDHLNRCEKRQQSLQSSNCDTTREY